MIRIAIVGEIGSGKSHVSKIFGFPVFNADDESALICELPASLVLEVTYTEPGEKGNTATNAFKPATVETGAEVRVPLFINNGDFIKINTTSGEYSERVKV